MNFAIEIKNLTKTYNSKRKGEISALKGISFNIKEGSIFGLLGPNGAGKSTLINILAGTVVKSGGDAIVDNINIEKEPLKYKYSIGIVPQEVYLDPFFSVREALDFYAGYYGIPKAERRTDEIIEVLNLGDKAHVRPRQLSGGMKRRLLVAKALVHNPKILVLDEPTAGVDVSLREDLWEYVRKLNKQGITIILTTHYLEEAEQLCDEIAVINKGEIIANDNKNRLLKDMGNKKTTLIFDKKIKGKFDGFEINGNEASTFTAISDLNLDKVIANFNAEGYKLMDLLTEQTSLEDIFKELVS